MLLHFNFIIGLIAGLLGPFVAVGTLVIAAHYTLDEGLLSGVTMALGNAIVQLIWGAVAGAAKNSQKF